MVKRLKGFSSNLSGEAQQEFEDLIHFFLICCQRQSESWDLHKPLVFPVFYFGPKHLCQRTAGEIPIQARP